MSEQLTPGTLPGRHHRRCAALHLPGHAALIAGSNPNECLDHSCDGCIDFGPCNMHPAVCVRAASLAIGSGANPKVVQRMLGHASAAMTLDVYADLFDSDFTAVADKLSETVGKVWARGGDAAIQPT
jgi:integrase